MSKSANVTQIYVLQAWNLSPKYQTKSLHRINFLSSFQLQFMFCRHSPSTIQLCHLIISFHTDCLCPGECQISIAGEKMSILYVSRKKNYHSILKIQHRESLGRRLAWAILGSKAGNQIVFLLIIYLKSFQQKTPVKHQHTPSLWSKHWSFQLIPC